MPDLFLCPSMMCADFTNLEKEMTDLDQAKADIYHIDIMDGQFVPNFSMGLHDFSAIRALTNQLVDVHLMIQNPGEYIDLFSDLGADIIYFHPEADLHPGRTIDKIHANGKKAGIAINPGTSLETVRELFPLIDYLLVMTVNPGFAGQAYLDYVNPKIQQAVEYGESFQFEVMVDGAISEEKIFQLADYGVKGFILGTSTLFGKEASYETILKEVREKLEKKEQIK